MSVAGTNVNMPSVSVGLPVYNGERYLRVAIDCILNQTFGDWELIICDNASTDGTEAICRDYAGREPRIRYYRLATNIGAARNYCRVLELARAPYFKWIAADDYVGAEFLERCKRMLDASPEVVVCTTKADLVDQDGRLIHHYAEKQELPQARASDRMIASRDLDSWCLALYGLMRTDVLRRTAVMGSYVGSDSVLLAEMSLYGRFAEVPDYLLFRRFHPEAYSYNVDLDKMKSFYAPAKKSGTTLVLRLWRHLYEYVRAVFRAPLPISEKTRLYVHILRMTLWSRATLVAEIVAAWRHLVARGGPRSS